MCRVSQFRVVIAHNTVMFDQNVTHQKLARHAGHIVSFFRKNKHLIVGFKRTNGASFIWITLGIKVFISTRLIGELEQ